MSVTGTPFLCLAAFFSAFLPAAYQGTAVGTADVPIAKTEIPFLKNLDLLPARQRRQLDLIQRLNREHLAAIPERHKIPVKLKKGVNTLLMKIVNGSDPHGFYLSVTSEQELKVVPVK